MSLASELEVEMTNLWSLLHSTASGCISIGLWELIKEFQVGVLGTWSIFLVASASILHAVHRHRRAVYATLRTREQAWLNSSEHGAGVTNEP